MSHAYRDFIYFMITASQNCKIQYLYLFLSLYDHAMNCFGKITTSTKCLGMLFFSNIFTNLSSGNVDSSCLFLKCLVFKTTYNISFVPFPISRPSPINTKRVAAYIATTERFNMISNFHNFTVSCNV